MAFWNSWKDKDKERSSAQQNTQNAQVKPETAEKTYKPDKPKQTAQQNIEPYKPDYDQFAQTHDEHVLNATRAALSVMPEEQKKMDEAIRRAGKQIGHGLSEQDGALLKGLRRTGITNTAAGNIDLPTASMDTLVRAASGIPDAGKRKEAYGYLKGLTKVKNGRFYGYSLTGSDPGYIDSADMPKADYDVLVKELNAKFYASKGHEEENLREYLSLYDKIQGMPVTDVQKYWYTDALKSAYTEQTGLKNPDVYELRKALGEYDLGNQEDEGKKGWFSSLWEKISGKKDEDGDQEEDGTQAEAEKEPAQTPPVSPLPTPPAPEPEATPQPPKETPAPEAEEAEEATAEVQGPPAPTATPAPAASQEAQEPVAAPLEAPEVQGSPAPTATPAPAASQEAQEPVAAPLEAPEVQGPPAPQKAQEEQKPPAPGSIHLAGDPVRAITQYVRQNRGNELDAQTRQAVDEYVGSSKAVQAMTGLDAADTVSMYEEAENDPFALARANAARFDLYAGNVSSVIGSTLGGYYARIQSESFPESLRDDAMGVLMGVGRDAEEAYRSGRIDVPEDGNLYEAYLNANPGALDNIRGVFRTLTEMDREAREQARQTEEQAALAARERLDIARAHVRSGDFTGEDYALVEASAPVITTADAMDDETYSDAIIELRVAVSASYMEDGGWFNEETERYLRSVGLNVSMDSVVALDYKDTLAGYVQDEILNDLRVARALGYDSLGAYYDRQGGMNLENLYARATLSMERFGQSVTQEDMDAAQALVYQGTGEDVGALDVLGTGMKLGTVSTGSELLEAIWTRGQNANANRADLQSRMRIEYTKQWGPALAAYMFTQDWMNALDSGATPSGEYAQYVRDYIAGGGDVFLMGPPPSMKNAVLRGAVKADKAVAETMQYVQKNMNAGQGRLVDIISSTMSNVELQAMATVITGLTGSPVLGTSLSFGLAEYSPTVREQLAGGRTLSQANAMGMAHAATTAIANAPTSGKFTGKIFGALGITPSVINGASMAGSTAPAKTMAGMIKAFGKGFLKGAGEMAVDELFIDEAKERGLWALASGTGEAMMDGAGVLEAIGAGLAGTDVTQIASDIIADAPEGFVCMLPMIFMGGLSDGVSGVKANWPKTTRAAQKLAQTGTAEAAREFVSSMNEEIQSPEARQELNDAMQGAAAGHAAAGAMLTDPEIRQKAESAQKAIEQAESHEATLEAETARREAAREGYEHAKEIGDVDAQLAAMDEYTKASHNMADAQKEAQQKRTEADSLAAQAVDGALRKGEAYVEEQRRAVEDTVMNSDSVLDARYASAEADFIAAAESGDMARMEADDASMDAIYPTGNEEASVGSTDYEASEDISNQGMLNPVMQQRASDLYKKTGLTLMVAPLPEGVRGYYDRGSGQIVLSNRIGVGEMNRMTTIHELTHFIEGSRDYDAFSDAVLVAAYDGNADAMSRDAQEIRDRYDEMGIPFDERKELVTAAVEKVINADETFLRDLIGQKKQGLIARIYAKLKQFLARRRAKSEGADALRQYDLIQTAHDRMKQALSSSEKWTQGQEGVQLAIDWASNGERIVRIEEDILDGVPQKEWAKTVSTSMKEKFPNGITVGNNQIQITKKSRREITNARDTMWLKANQPDVYADKLRAANNAGDIVQASTDYVDEGLNHERKDGITDFARGKVNIEVGGQMYSAEVIVGTRRNGEMLLYDFVRMTKKEMQRTAARQSAAHGSHAASLSDISVAQGGTDVKNQSMQNEREYAVAPRQFGNQTAQESDYFYDEVKERLLGSSYETETNSAQIRRAVDRLNNDGLDATVDYLLGIEPGRFTTDDNVLLMAAAVQAGRNNDVTLQWKLADRLDKEGTEQGRALQSRKILTQALRPQQEISVTVQKAIEANRKKGLPASAVPAGNDAPGKATEGTKKAVRDVYDRAESEHMQLLQLPDGLSRDNPWKLPLNAMQGELISRYSLWNETLPGIEYNRATLKQRMLAAILATPNNVRGDGLLTLCQQLEFMRQGYAVVTEADMNYIASQMSEAIAGGMDDAGQPISQEAKDAMGRLYDAEANTRQKTLGEKVTTLAFTNMLSSTGTWTRNILSNVLVAPLENASRDIAAWVDQAVSSTTETRTTGRTTREERTAGKQAFASEVANTVRDYFVTHTDTGHGRKYQVGDGTGGTYQNEFIETYRNIVDFAMQIGDRPFFEKCYAEEKSIIERLGMRVVDEETQQMRTMTADEIHAEATARAAERVFQEDGSVIKWINSAPNPFAFVMRSFIPFVKTPTNIAKRMFQYSPAGLAKAIVYDGFVKANINGGSGFDQRKFVMGIGRGMTGLGVIAAGAVLGASRLMKPGYGEDDKANRRTILSTLGEPYGWYLDLFGQKHAIDWALPSATGLILGASMVSRMDDGEDAMQIAVGMMYDLADELFDNSMLSAINDIFRGYDDASGIAKRLAETFAESKMNQMLSPSFIRQIAKATDPYVRDTSDSNAVMQAIKQNVIQYWPVLRQMLPIKTDITGDEAMQSNYWNPGRETGNVIMNFIDSYMTPTATIGEKNDEALIELLDLSYRTGEASFLPGYLIASNKYELSVTKTQSKSLGTGSESYTISLSDEEKRLVNAMYANTLFNGSGGLRSIMNGREWAQMDDAERIKKVKEAKDAAKLSTLRYVVKNLL